MTNFGFTPYIGNAPFLFISYKSEESPIVAEYARTLHNGNIPVYYDAALRPGQDWENELLTTITKPNCAGVILMMSNRALQSVHIRDEIRAAHRSGKPILAVYLEAVTDMDMSMRAYIENIQDVKLWQIPDAMGRHAAVYNGALNLLQGNLTGSAVRNDATQLYDNAKVYINNYRVSGKQEDLERAKEEYKKITESYASDYRGWMGLIECECLEPCYSLSDTIDKFQIISGYYSYVLSAGASSATQEEFAQCRRNLCMSAIRSHDKTLARVRELVGRADLGTDDLRSITSSYSAPSLGFDFYPGLIHWYADELLTLCDKVRDIPDIAQTLVFQAEESLRLTIAYSYLAANTVLSRYGAQEGAFSAWEISKWIDDFFKSHGDSMTSAFNRLGNAALINDYNALVQYLNNCRANLSAACKAELQQEEAEKAALLAQQNRALIAKRKAAEKDNRKRMRAERRSKIPAALATVLLTVLSLGAVWYTGVYFISGFTYESLPHWMPEFVINHPHITALLILQVVTIVANLSLASLWKSVYKKRWLPCTLQIIAAVLFSLSSLFKSYNSCQSCFRTEDALATIGGAVVNWIVFTGYFLIAFLHIGIAVTLCSDKKF